MAWSNKSKLHMFGTLVSGTMAHIDSRLTVYFVLVIHTPSILHETKLWNGAHPSFIIGFETENLSVGVALSNVAMLLILTILLSTICDIYFVTENKVLIMCYW